jgi:uncharacterized protein
MPRRYLWLAVTLGMVVMACTPEKAVGGPPSHQPRAGSAKTPPSAHPQTDSIDAVNDSTQPRVILTPPGRPPVSVKVELAKTPQERAKGLMYRQYLPAESGMLFVFDKPQELAFWMHNTYIPLDMIFIRSDATVLGVIENTKPLNDQSLSVPGLSQYVLEVNAFFTRTHGIAAGTRVTLPVTATR